MSKGVDDRQEDISNPLNVEHMHRAMVDAAGVSLMAVYFHFDQGQRRLSNNVKEMDGPFLCWHLNDKCHK